MKKEENDIQYDIVKSEACGHSIEYKRLAKQFGAPGMPPMGGGAPMAAPAGGPAGAAPMMMNEDKEEECKCKGENKEDCECEKESPKDDLEKNTDQEVRETKGIDHDKERDSDKTKEEESKIKRPLEKCGDMIAAKKSERFYVKEIQRLKKKEMTELKKQSAVDLYMGGKPTKKQLMNRGVRSLKEKAQNFAQNRAKKAAQKAAEKKFAERLARGGSIERVAGKAGRGAKFLRGAGKVAAPLTAGLAAADATKRAYQMATGDSGKLDKELMDKYKRNVSEGNYLDMALDPVDTAIGGLSTGAKKAMDYFDVGGDKEAQRIMAEADKKAAAKKQARAGITQKGIDTVGNLLEEKKSTQNMTKEDPSKAMTKEDPSKAMSVDKPASTKNPSFKQAFTAARQARLAGTGGDEFDYGGKKFHSYSKQDFNDMGASGKTNKYYDAYKRKAIGSSPATPNTATPPAIGPGNKTDPGGTMLRKPQPSFQEQQKMAASEKNSAQKLRKFMEKDSKKLEK